MERSTAKTTIKSESRRRFLTAAGSSLLLAACAAPSGPTAPRTGFVTVPGGRLYYEMAGQGQPIVMLHGFSCDTRMWDSQFTALSLSYCAIRYDLRGFGRSSTPNVGQTYTHSDDLRALLLQLELSKTHLLGASMGGRVALDFALTYPQHCGSLALINPVVGGWEWSAEWLASYAPVARAAKRGDVASAKAAWLAHPIFKPARANPTVHNQLRQMVNDYSGWHFSHADPAKELNPPAATQLARLGIPVLTLIGEQDLPDFQRIAELIERNGRAARVSLSGAGHWAGMEAPQRVNERLLSFFSGAV